MFKACIDTKLDTSKFNLRVSGSCPELGEWDPKRAVPMTLKEDGAFVTTVEIDLEKHPEVLYKYALYEGDRLRKFEALDSNRVFKGTADDKIAVSSMVSASLRDEIELFVKEAICSKDGCAVKEVVLVNNSDDESDTKRWNLSIGLETPTRIPISELDTPAILIKVEDGNGKTGTGIVGSELIHTKKRVHKMSIPILSETCHEMCQVMFSCLLVEPMPDPVEKELSAVRGVKPFFSRFIGHRGSGSTRKDGPKDDIITENTLLGFVSASRVTGAQGIEFDVHLTADCDPVVYHDVTYPVVSAGDSVVFNVPINHMSTSSALSLRPKLMDVNRGPGLSCPRMKDELSERPKKRCKESEFWERSNHVPLFRELFDYVPEKTGFDVEIKYFDNSRLEQKYNPFERNFYADTILGLVLQRTEAPCKRWLFYSSFDFDVCIMASRKQSRHDVFLLSIGDEEYCSHDCNRICPLEDAIDSAHMIGLRGIVTDSKNALKSPHLVEKAHKYGMVLLTYGALK